jgi:hypothetical protein
MAAQVDEHERTMAFAEIALGQIRALRQPATPRHVADHIRRAPEVVNSAVIKVA